MISQPPVELLHPIMTSTQSIIHDQLERRHNELQQIIPHQQDELRRVSQQLIIARYGLATNSTAPLSSVQPIVNHLSPNIVQAISGNSPVHHVAEHHMQHQQTPLHQSYPMAPVDHSISADHQASPNMHDYDEYSPYLQLTSMPGVQQLQQQQHAQHAHLLHQPQLLQHSQQLPPGNSATDSAATGDRQTSTTATHPHGDVMKILYHTR